MIYSIFLLYLIVSRSEEFFKVVDNSTQQKTIEKIVDTENFWYLPSYVLHLSWCRNIFLFLFFTDCWRFYFINFIFEHKGVLPSVPLSVLCEFCWFSSPPGLGWDLFPSESDFIISGVVVQHLDNGQEMLTRIPFPHFEKVKAAFVQL